MLDLLLLGMLFIGFTLLVWGLWPRTRPAQPHCGACGYSLRGLALAPDRHSPCPECGGDLSLTTRLDGRTRRPMFAAIGALLAFVGTVPLVWVACRSDYGHAWYSYGRLDLNSGRERQDHYLLGLRISARESETPLSKLIESSGGSLGPPKWVGYRYSGSGLADVRINFRYAKAHITLRSLVDFFDVVDAPEDDRAAVARAALEAAKAEHWIWLYPDFERGYVRIMGGNPERLLVDWKAEER